MLKIHQFLSQFQNGFRLRKSVLLVDFHKTHLELCRFFLEHGLIRSFHVKQKEGIICLEYKYTWDGKSLIKSFKVLSKKRVRHYTKKPNALGEKHRITVISTNRGLLTKDQCFLFGVGGEELFQIIF